MLASALVAVTSAGGPARSGGAEPMSAAPWRRTGAGADALARVHRILRPPDRLPRRQEALTRAAVVALTVAPLVLATAPALVALLPCLGAQPGPAARRASTTPSARPARSRSAAAGRRAAGVVVVDLAPSGVTTYQPPPKLWIPCPGLARGLVAGEVVERVAVVGDLAGAVGARAGADERPAPRRVTGAAPAVSSGGHTCAHAPVQVEVVPVSASNRYSARPAPSTSAVPGASAAEPIRGAAGAAVRRAVAARRRRAAAGAGAGQRDAERRAAAGEHGGGEHAAEDVDALHGGASGPLAPCRRTVGGRGAAGPPTAPSTRVRSGVQRRLAERGCNYYPY